MDTRIVYGANCVWWDSIHATSTLRGVSPIPCCPFCRSVLFEVSNIDEFMKGVDDYEQNGNPGYRDLLLWVRGKCFKSMAEAKIAKEKE